MYAVDHLDRVAPVDDVPAPDIGAPAPTVWATESQLVVAYYVRGAGRSVGVVQFQSPYSHFLGPPNDEALNGHPLYGRGLESYGAYEVVESSWIRQLERMNSVHPEHNPRVFADYRHFIIVFHDSIFESVAEGLESSVEEGPPARVVGRLAAAAS